MPTRRCTTTGPAPPSAHVALEPYLGRCRVIHAIGRGPLIEWAHLEHALADLPPRVLVRTYARQPEGWDPDLAAFAPQTVERLADLGVLLIGIDTASIDPAESKDAAQPPGDPPPRPARAGEPARSTTCPKATTN